MSLPSLLFSLVAMVASGGSAAAQEISAPMEVEIARIERLAGDPDTKLRILHAMALELGTHRNQIIWLRKQSGEPFGRVYVAELRKRGAGDEQILAKLRAVQRSDASAPEEAQGGAFVPVAFLSTSVNRNSAGTFAVLHAQAGVDSGRFALIGGVPVYRLDGRGLQATGVGDAYAAAFARLPAGRFHIDTAFTLSAPTGDHDQGLGAGRVSVDLNGTVERRFERLRPFATLGFTNSLFNNVGYQRPFISNGNALYGAGGLDFRIHRRLTLGVGGFGLHGMGEHLLISQAPAPPVIAGSGTPGGHMGPGMGGGVFGPGRPFTTPVFSVGRETLLAGAEVSDSGASAWAGWSLTPEITLHINVARSVSYDLTTVRAGLTFNLSRPFARLFGR